MAIMQECIPAGVLPPRHRKLPWLNKGVIQSMRRRKLSKKAKKILQRVFTSINVQETRLSHWWGLPKRNISMNSIHIMWSSSGSQSKSWTSIIRQSPHNPRDLLYILSTDMEKAAAL